jgi:hypothetical protein
MQIWKIWLGQQRLPAKGTTKYQFCSPGLTHKVPSGRRKRTGREISCVGHAREECMREDREEVHIWRREGMCFGALGKIELLQENAQ